MKARQSPPDAHRRALILLAALRAHRVRRRESAAQEGRTIDRRIARRRDLLDLPGLMKFARDLPLGGPAQAALLLAEAPRARSKAAMVRDAMAAAGHPPHVPRTMGRGPGAVLRRAGLTMRALPLVVALGRRRLRLPKDDLAFVLACKLAERLSAARPGWVPVLISDLSPRRMALGVGAGLAGNRALWWQIDLHAAALPRIGLTHGAVASAQGLEPARDAGLEVMALPVHVPAPIRMPERIAILGLAPNALPSPDLISRGLALKEALGADRVLLRLHPRDDGAWLGPLPPGIVRAPETESLDAFCAGCDAVICGNSAVQLKVVLSGVPAIHVAGIDYGDFDDYGYVARGLVFGTREAGEVTPEALAAHYGRPEMRAALTAVTALPASVPPLAEGLAALVGRAPDRHAPVAAGSLSGSVAR